MIKGLLTLLLLVPTFLMSQGWLPMGAKSNSMANASITNVDAWAFHHNPGALANVDRMAIGVSYENRFLLKELQSQGLVYVQPIKTGVISAGAQLYGYDQFRTYRAGLGYSLKLSEKFSAGVQLNYQGLRLNGNYGTKNSVSAEMGILGNITENWKIGASVFNIGRAKLSDYQDDRFTTLMRLGTGYTFSKKVLATAEVEKNVDYPLRVKAGIDYQVINNFFLRAGFATEPVEASFGFGYKFKMFQIDFGSSYHQQLGWSPHFSLTYQKN